MSEVRKAMGYGESDRERANRLQAENEALERRAHSAEVALRLSTTEVERLRAVIRNYEKTFSVWPSALEGSSE